jgi:hypothetical protein
MSNNYTPSRFRPSTVTNLSYSTSAGAAVSTAGFGTQTYWISLTAPGAITSTGGVRYTIGKSATASATASPLLPFNWTEVVRVSPGEQLSAVSNDGVAGTLVVVELS